MRARATTNSSVRSTDQVVEDTVLVIKVEKCIVRHTGVESIEGRMNTVQVEGRPGIVRNRGRDGSDVDPARVVHSIREGVVKDHGGRIDLVGARGKAVITARVITVMRTRQVAMIGSDRVVDLSIAVALNVVVVILVQVRMMTDGRGAGKAVVDAGAHAVDVEIAMIAVFLERFDEIVQRQLHGDLVRAHLAGH